MEAPTYCITFTETAWRYRGGQVDNKVNKLRFLSTQDGGNMNVNVVCGMVGAGYEPFVRSRVGAVVH